MEGEGLFITTDGVIRPTANVASVITERGRDERGRDERPASIPASSSSVTSSTTRGSSLGGGRIPSRGGRKADAMSVVLLSMQDECE